MSRQTLQDEAPPEHEACQYVVFSCPGVHPLGFGPWSFAASVRASPSIGRAVTSRTIHAATARARPRPLGCMVMRWWTRDSGVDGENSCFFVRSCRTQHPVRSTALKLLVLPSFRPWVDSIHWTYQDETRIDPTRRIDTLALKSIQPGLQAERHMAQ